MIKKGRRMGKNYDVIVLGAGPSGLAVGSELGKELNVLILDKKEEIADCKKSWFVPYKAIKDGNAEELMKNCFNGVTRFFTDTFGGADIDWEAYGKYPYVNEKKLLEYWAEKAEMSGVEIKLKSAMTDFEIGEELVEVRCGEEVYKSRLLIDASGSKSQVKEKLKIQEKALYYWSVYGAIVEFPQGLPETLKVGDYQLWQTFENTNQDKEASMAKGRPIFEYEILDEKTAFVFAFYLKQDLVDIDILKKTFEDIMKEKNVECHFEKSSIKEIKYGWYPSGGVLSPKVAENRISFIGDAGCWTTPCGWGATTIIANYKRYSEKLIPLVKRDELKRDDLRRINTLDMYTRNQFRMNQLITHFLAHAPASLLDDFINFFKPGEGPLGDRGPKLCEDVFTLNLSEEEVFFLLKGVLEHFDMLELAKIMPKSDLLNLIMAGGNFIEASIVDKISKILHHINPHLPYEDKFEDGFTF